MLGLLKINTGLEPTLLVYCHISNERNTHQSEIKILFFYETSMKFSLSMHYNVKEPVWTIDCGDFRVALKLHLPESNIILYYSSVY